MKLRKAWFSALLIGLVAVPVLAAETKGYDSAIGARIVPYGSFQRSVDFLYSPSFGIGGLVEENSGYEVTFQGSPIFVRTKEITAFVGYWSNAKRTSWLGWHAYLGIGVSFVDVESQKYTAVSPAISHDKSGLGLDLYLGCCRALTADVLVVSRPPLPIKGEMVMPGPMGRPVVTPMVYQLDSITRDVVFQVGCRVWF